jgi:type I restriction-modification system DNA methylase subunit
MNSRDRRSTSRRQSPVVAPQPGQTICDSACGTGGFLLAAHDYLAKHHALDRAKKRSSRAARSSASYFQQNFLAQPPKLRQTMHDGDAGMSKELKAELKFIL